jgi:tetratricopeptide (TPR) repeat protein
MPALGLQVTRVALERPGAHARSLERCRALVTAGWMCTWASRDEESVRYMEEALRLARDVADATTLCLVLTKFAHVRHHRNENEDASRLASEALAVGRPLADCVELGDALNLRAHVHARCGERESARSLFIEALSLRKRMKNATGMVSVHLNLAYMAIDAGSPDEAKPHLDEVLVLLPLADSQSAGINFIGVTAQWAALAGRHEAACSGQLDRAGMRNELERVEVERLERAGLALEAQTRERLESDGRVLSYEQVLQRVAISLKGEPSFGLTHSPT